MTLQIHRTIIVVPIGAKLTAVGTWLAANVDPTTDTTKWPGLSATGAAPATYRWECCAWTDAQCKAILAKLCQLASVTPPTNTQWDGWTQAQKISWLASVRATIKTNYGVYVTLASNTGTWDSPDGVLTALGLKRIGP